MIAKYCNQQALNLLKGNLGGDDAKSPFITSGDKNTKSFAYMHSVSAGNKALVGMYDLGGSVKNGLGTIQVGIGTKESTKNLGGVGGKKKNDTTLPASFIGNTGSVEQDRDN